MREVPDSGEWHEMETKRWKKIAIIACVAGVVFLAYHGRDGWGWLIFLALCLT